MAARKQADSDPLPYVQVDRSAKPRAALLAGSLGVTPQHALGSLVEWWDLNGDPRELERIAMATPAGVEPAVLVTRDDAAARFKLASGKDCDPLTLVHLGLLEQVGDRFRVRGMSRYFEPVMSRIRARRAASAGGKASAESRRATTGSAQPRSGVASEFASSPGQADLKADFEATPKRDRSDAEAESNPSGQRSAVSGQRQETSAPRAATLAKSRVSDELCADFESVTGSAYLWSGAKDGVALAALLKAASLEEVRTRWRRGLEAPSTAWASCRTVAELRSKWNHLGTPTRDVTRGVAEPSDWTGRETREVTL